MCFDKLSLYLRMNLLFYQYLYFSFDERAWHANNGHDRKQHYHQHCNPSLYEYFIR